MPSYYSNVQYKSDCIIKYIDILLEGAKKRVTAFRFLNKK